VALAGCVATGGDCLEPLDGECASLYEPNFDQVFNQTLLPSCGVGGASCHAPEGTATDLVLADARDAWAQLTAGDSPLVVAGDPECSPLMERLETGDPERLMPPGAPLSDEERCAIQRWIAEGAAR